MYMCVCVCYFSDVFLPFANASKIGKGKISHVQINNLRVLTGLPEGLRKKKGLAKIRYVTQKARFLVRW